MADWKSVTVRLRGADVASLNQRLAQAGYNTLGEMVRAYISGIISNTQLVESLAEAIAERIVVKMSTLPTKDTSQRVISPSPDGMNRAVVVQSGLASLDVPRGHQPSKLVTRVQIPATAD